MLLVAAIIQRFAGLAVVLLAGPASDVAVEMDVGCIELLFTRPQECVQALDRLIAAVKATGADMVLSYPTNGLVYEAGGDPTLLLKKHFRSVERGDALPHIHSTFGASKGAAKSMVTEHIYLGRA